MAQFRLELICISFKIFIELCQSVDRESGSNPENCFSVPNNETPRSSAQRVNLFSDIAQNISIADTENDEISVQLSMLPIVISKGSTKIIKPYNVQCTCSDLFRTNTRHSLPKATLGPRQTSSPRARQDEKVGEKEKHHRSDHARGSRSFDSGAGARARVSAARSIIAARDRFSRRPRDRDRRRGYTRAALAAVRARFLSRALALSLSRLGRCSACQECK